MNADTPQRRLSRHRRRGGAISRGRSALGSLPACPPRPPRAAHLVTTGMGPVYDGIGHLLLTPEDLVPVLALALYAGLRGAAAGRRAMFLLPLCLVRRRAGRVGGGAAAIASPCRPCRSSSSAGSWPRTSACRPPRSRAWRSRSASSTVPERCRAREGAGTLGLVGITAMLFVLVTLASALVVSLGKPWARIAVRVAGSWIAAIGLLMFGWALRE